MCLLHRGPLPAEPIEAGCCWDWACWERPRMGVLRGPDVVLRADRLPRHRPDAVAGPDALLVRGLAGDHGHDLAGKYIARRLASRAPDHTTFLQITSHLS